MADSPHGFQWEPEPHESHHGDDANTACEDGTTTDPGASIFSSIVSAAWPQPVTAETHPSASKSRAVSSKLCTPFTPCTPAPRPSTTPSQAPDTSGKPCTGSTFYSVFWGMQFLLKIYMICKNYFFVFFFLDISSSQKHNVYRISTPNQWRETQTDSRRWSRWAQAQVLGKEQSSSLTLQTEEENLGDVTGKKGRGTYTHKSAATGTKQQHLMTMDLWVFSA